MPDYCQDELDYPPREPDESEKDKLIAQKQSIMMKNKLTSNDFKLINRINEKLRGKLSSDIKERKKLTSPTIDESVKTIRDLFGG